MADVYSGAAEAAELFGVSKQVLHNWRKRKVDFPKPVAELALGPVWKTSDLLDWFERRKKRE